MPHEKNKSVKAWLVKANDDLGAGANDLNAKEPFIDSCLFHCQQAVEKSLKGFLSFHSIPFGKMHDLLVLGREVVLIKPELRSLLTEASKLTPYATAFRYPGLDTDEDESMTLEEANSSLKLASDVYQAILACLPSEVRPEK